MLLLNTTPEVTPAQLELPNGVTMQMRPLTTAMLEAAKSEANRKVATLLAEAEAAKASGVPLDELGANGANTAWLDGVFREALCAALMRYGVIAWQGLADQNKVALDPVPAAFEALAKHPLMGPAFRDRYEATIPVAVAEGNGSGTTSAESSAAAENTAPAAPRARKATAAEPAPTA